MRQDSRKAKTELCGVSRFKGSLELAGCENAGLYKLESTNIALATRRIVMILVSKAKIVPNLHFRALVL
jgi:hypothetical protein